MWFALQGISTVLIDCRDFPLGFDVFSSVDKKWWLFPVSRLSRNIIFMSFNVHRIQCLFSKTQYWSCIETPHDNKPIFCMGTHFLISCLNHPIFSLFKICHPCEGATDLRYFKRTIKYLHWWLHRIRKTFSLTKCNHYLPPWAFHPLSDSRVDLILGQPVSFSW